MTTPDPKSPPGGGLPSRHRPVLDNLAKDTLEEELWALDDDDMRLEEDGPVAPPVSTAPVTGRSSFHVPPRRDAGGVRSVPPSGNSEIKEGETSAAKPPGGIQMNVGKIAQVRRGDSKMIEPARLESAFDDLDEWDDVPVAEPDMDPLPETGGVFEPETAAAGPPDSHLEPEAADSPEVPVAPAPESLVGANLDTDEFSPPVRQSVEPVSLKPRIRLSGVERIGLIVLTAGLIVCGAVIYSFSINRLPTRSLSSQNVDFPVKGKIMTVTAATSYWRAPVVDGPDREAVRRGTIYIPVVEVATSSGVGAVRAVFRDHDRKSIGDMVTQPTGGAGVVRLAGTAGFEEAGTHAAYRASVDKPWSVEIFEAPSVDSPSTDFKSLFQMNLSTETR